MSKRICPSCKSVLGTHDGYFCSTCGKPLPKELISISNTVKMRTYTPIEAKEDVGNAIKKVTAVIRNKSTLLSALLVVLIAAVLFGISNSGLVELLTLQLQNRFNLNLGAGLPQEVTTAQTFSLGFPVESLAFGQSNLISYAPEQATLVFEVASLENVLEYVEFVSKNEELASRAILLLEPEFLGFSYVVERANRWGYVFTPKDLDLVEEVIADVEHDYWRLRMIGGKLIVANGDDVFDAVEEVYAKRSRSVALNPNYAQRVHDLPVEGHMRIVFMDPTAEQVIRNSLSGLTQDTIGIINRALATKFTHFIVTE